MATKCGRILNRASMASLKSSIKPSSSSTSYAAAPPSLPRFNFSRMPKELGGALSLMPLHSTVAVARMMSCLNSTASTCRALSQGT